MVEGGSHNHRASRLDRLQTVTSALSGALSPEQVVAVARNEVAAALGGTGVAMATLSPDGRTLHTIQALDNPTARDEAWQSFSIDAPVPMAEAVRTTRPVWPETAAARAAHYPEAATFYHAIGPLAWVSLPLLVDERPIGGLSIAFAEIPDWDEVDRTFALTLAGQCAYALERARLYAAERQARAEAERALRAREVFLSIVSHELRNPLASLRGTAQLLRRAHERGQLEPERMERYLGTIEHMTERLATLANDLLDVSRLEAGALPIRPRSTDVAALIRDAVARQQARAEEHPVRVEIAADHCVLSVDPDRIEQIVVNLLENAVKYSPADGEVVVSLSDDGDGLVLRVQDHGIGLPPDATETIFEPFGRAPNAVAHDIPGLGLGLYICRRLADQHGGRLWAESAGEGQGTTFALWIPRTPVP